jgi:hypothetical protein
MRVSCLQRRVFDIDFELQRCPRDSGTGGTGTTSHPPTQAPRVTRRLPNKSPGAQPLLEYYNLPTEACLIVDVNDLASLLRTIWGA